MKFLNLYENFELDPFDEEDWDEDDNVDTDKYFYYHALYNQTYDEIYKLIKRVFKRFHNKQKGPFKSELSFDRLTYGNINDNILPIGIETYFSSVSYDDFFLFEFKLYKTKLNSKKEEISHLKCVILIDKYNDINEEIIYQLFIFDNGVIKNQFDSDEIRDFDMFINFYIDKISSIKWRKFLKLESNNFDWDEDDFDYEEENDYNMITIKSRPAMWCSTLVNDIDKKLLGRRNNGKSDGYPLDLSFPIDCKLLKVNKNGGYIGGLIEYKDKYYGIALDDLSYYDFHGKTLNDFLVKESFEWNEDDFDYEEEEDDKHFVIGDIVKQKRGAIYYNQSKNRTGTIINIPRKDLVKVKWDGLPVKYMRNYYPVNDLIKVEQNTIKENFDWDEDDFDYEEEDDYNMITINKRPGSWSSHFVDDMDWDLLGDEGGYPLTLKYPLTCKLLKVKKINREHRHISSTYTAGLIEYKGKYYGISLNKNSNIDFHGKTLDDFLVKESFFNEDDFDYEEVPGDIYVGDYVIVKDLFNKYPQWSRDPYKKYNNKNKKIKVIKIDSPSSEDRLSGVELNIYLDYPDGYDNVFYVPLDTVEKVEQHPKLNDYVILKYNKKYSEIHNKLNVFLTNSIGKITEVLEDYDYDDSIVYEYRVKYDNAPREIEDIIDKTHGYDDHNICVWDDDIDHFSSNKNDLYKFL